MQRTLPQPAPSSAPRKRIPNRNALFNALVPAVMPEAATRVLWLFGFEGLTEYSESSSLAAEATLLAKLGECIVETVGEDGSVFASRHGEFFAFLEGDSARLRPLLALVRSELDLVGGGFGVRSAFGSVELPGEARLPSMAVLLADKRLRDSSGNLRRRARLEPPESLPGASRSRGREARAVPAPR